MSNPIHLKRPIRAALVVGLAFAALPATAQAVPIDLATAKPFAVLGGSAVTNTGPSVLYGELGVSPGTSLTGFGAATVNGATHNTDAVAAQAQSDLTAAYTVAAAEPSSDLTGQDLGGKVLLAGAYRFTSSAQLTGALTLDAENNPNAQFVFQVTSALTTASASSVVLLRGASPCNVFWQIGSSATLGSTTAFQGNVMAYSSISLNNGATVRGRLLARNGQVSLINNVIDASMCGSGSTATPPPGSPTETGPGSGAPAGEADTTEGTAVWSRTPRTTGSWGEACADGFRATLRGRQIERVVFRLDGRRIATRSRAPFHVYVTATPGRHNLSARVTFKDATRAKTMNLGYRACAAVVLQPRPGPSRFTG